MTWVKTENCLIVLMKIHASDTKLGCNRGLHSLPRSLIYTGISGQKACENVNVINIQTILINS